MLAVLLVAEAFAASDPFIAGRAGEAPSSVFVLGRASAGAFGFPRSGEAAGCGAAAAASLLQASISG